MPRKGMRSIFFNSSKTPSSSSNSTYPSPLRTPSSTPRYVFSESMMEGCIVAAESIVKKWDPNGSTFAKYTSLFHESRQEAKEFIKRVKNLQQAMHFYVLENSTSEKLVRAQNLMQIAMKRLEKEFYQILSANRDHLDPESVSGSSRSTRSSTSEYDDYTGSDIDEIQKAGDSITEVEEAATIAMSDLKAIAECMISSGYGKECVHIYKIIRKSIIDEGIYRLGVERWSSSQIQKMDWEVLQLKIKNWLDALKIAVKTLFSGERILSDHVFSSSESIKESCFSEISKEGAITLFGFPELVAKSKKSTDKMFSMLDLYNAISQLWPEIQSIFSYDSTSIVRSQAITSLAKLGEAVRSMLMEFELSIQKNYTKSPIPGGGLHPLTQSAMNYLCFLADYSGILSDIVADWPLEVQSPMPESYFEISDSDDNPKSSITVRLAWLILVLLCKLDTKGELYKDVSLSYLFLANNLNFVITKVRSSNLRYLLGEEWITKHESKVGQYSANYEQMGWHRVLSALPENSTESISPAAAKEIFKRFNSVFDETVKTQSSWIVVDEKLKEEIKVSIVKKLVPAYRTFYGKYRELLRNEKNSEVVVRFAPDDLENYLSGLFNGTEISGSTSTSSSSSTSSRSRWSRFRR